MFSGRNLVAVPMSFFFNTLWWWLSIYSTFSIFSQKESNECTKIQRRNGQNWFLRLLRGDSQLDCDAPVRHIAAVESDPGTWVTWRPILPSGYD